MKLIVAHTSGKNTELEVSSDIFGVKPNMNLLAQAVYIYQSNQRQGTSKVKTRSDINRTKKKWYKQKGTGNARHGARTPNIFVGGGISHGPTGMRNWTRTLTKSQKQKALVYALSARAKDIIISNEVEEVQAKTQAAVKFFNTIVKEADRILVVVKTPTEHIIRATRNLENILVTQADRLNVYEMLLADSIVMTKDAVQVIEKRCIGEKEEPKEEKKEVMKSTTTKTPVKKTTKKVEKKTVKKAK